MQEAHFENRIYYFKLISKSKDEVVINAYNTVYTFRKNGDTWMNHSNRMNMVQGLINAVIAEVFKEG
ncbi:hypothetical protein QTN47_10935 [Danxiaibacter flavus]|uniref:Uncharacterized protein n=1 Tax=Danxiaibacter flavus TaxID=3049108 RepID=A0ABV3ZDS7_9BACT|nr:hypothetical protein QNM32_10940 [Chitinophagaceae bacterium DXS]